MAFELAREHDSTLDEDHIANITFSVQPEAAVLTGRREHDAGWVVGCWYLAAFFVAVWGDSAYMSPLGTASLFWTLAGVHATTMAIAYNKTSTEARGNFGYLVPHLIIATVINGCLALLCCEATRKMYLATVMGALRRVEQLLREKERLDYERKFAEMKLRLATPDAARRPSLEPRAVGANGDAELASDKPSSIPHDDEASAAGVLSTGDERSNAAICRPGAGEGPSTGGGTDAPAVSKKRDRSEAGLPSLPSAPPSSASASAISSHRPSGSRDEHLPGVSNGASNAPSHVSKGTDRELLDMFLDPPPAPPPRRLIKVHPLQAYAFVLKFGKRLPGPMPGRMPAGWEPPV